MGSENVAQVRRLPGMALHMHRPKGGFVYGFIQLNHTFINHSITLQHGMQQASSSRRPLTELVPGIERQEL
jgi:hypothetical protein